MSYKKRVILFIIIMAFSFLVVASLFAFNIKSIVGGIGEFDLLPKGLGESVQ